MNVEKHELGQYTKAATPHAPLRETHGSSRGLANNTLHVAKKEASPQCDEAFANQMIKLLPCTL